MPKYDYPDQEHRPTLMTPNEVLADELATYKTPQEFSQFMLYVNRSYGRTALARALSEESRRLAAARLYSVETTNGSLVEEHRVLYAGALLSTFAIVRTFHPHKHAHVMNINHVEGIDFEGDTTSPLYRSRVAAHYVDIIDEISQERDEIHASSPELAELLVTASQRIADSLSSGSDNTGTVEEGLLYGNRFITLRSTFYESRFPGCEQLSPKHFSM